MNDTLFELPGARAGFTMACRERPQVRLENVGVRAASDTELVALVLQGGKRPEDAINLAARLLADAGSLPALLSWSPADYRRMPGVGRTKGLQLAAIAELGRRMMTPAISSRPVLERADSVAAYLAPAVAGLQVEKFWVLCLDRKSRLLKQVEVSSGTATTALAHPREVFRAAIRESATAVVCAHNHPSGDPAPSAPDLHVTRLLREASRTVDIGLLDHVILGTRSADPQGRGYFSCREAGLL